MDTPEFVYNRLICIQNKHPEYFEANNYRVLSCVEITWDNPISILVIQDDMPPDIRHEIETMFWRE